MAETNNFYGHIDDGNIRLTHGCCSHSCGSDLRKKLEGILNGAPESMDSFKEVYDEFGKLHGDIDNVFGDTNSKFDGIDSSFERLQQEIEDLMKQIDEMREKECCGDKCHNHHHHKCNDQYYENIIGALRDLKFSMNCEFAKRAQEISKLKEGMANLSMELKHLDILRVSKIEKVIKHLIDNDIGQLDIDSLMKKIHKLEHRVEKLEDNQCEG